MKRNIIVAILLLAAVAFSCTTKEEASKSLINDGSVVYNPTVAIAAFEMDGPATKTVLSIDESTGAKFTFVDGDALGVYPYDPEHGDQVRFTVKSQDATSCTFNGSGYGLMAGQLYAAYYPADLNNASADMVTQLPVDYTKQRQTSTDGTSFNISETDYLVSNGISPVNNTCDFTMSHLGALLVMDVTFAEAGNYKELKLTSTDAQFVRTGEVDLTAAAITVNPDASGAATLALGAEGGNGLSIRANQTVRFCMMVAPVNLKSSTVTITLTDSENVAHTGTFKNGNFKAGKAYLLTASVTSAAQPSEPINLSANGTANCYIVSAAGDYYFNATVAGSGANNPWFSAIGFGSIAYPPNGSPALTGNNVEVSLNQNNCVSDVAYENGTISFKATGERGNAKLTLRSGGTNIWTWLIWCTDQPKDVTYTSPSSNHSYTILDRNLGAITNTYDSAKPENSYGLYYMWGDPLGYTVAEWGNADNGGYQMVHELTTPNKPYYAFNGTNDFSWYGRDAFQAYKPYVNCYIWGAWGDATGDLYGVATYAKNEGTSSTKSLHDPCPPGYKVLSYDALNGFNDTSAFAELSADEEGFYLTGTNGNVAFFPYAGAVFNGGYQTDPNSAYLAPHTYVWLWTSAANYNNMCYCWYIYEKDPDRAGGGQLDTHIMTRGMSVRCMK